MESRVSIFHLVIEEFDKLNNKYILEGELNEYLSKNQAIRFYALILHDSDVDLDGASERFHYHVDIVLKNPILKMTLVNDIARELFINVNCISSRFVKNHVSSVQYLVHKNHKEKFQYNLTDIWTNDFEEVLNCIQDNRSSYELEIDYLIKLVKENQSIMRIYSILGLKLSKQYRSIIQDIWHDVWGW